MSEVSKVEQYVASKNWEYQVSGDQIVVRVCPFCESGDFKFYINKDTWLFDCKRGSCGVRGNEWKLKKQAGDATDYIPGQVFAFKDKPKSKGIPDVAAAHQALLENDEVLNWLNDDYGWSLDVVKQQKIGVEYKFIQEEGKEVPCLVYPYFNGSKCTFVKWRTIPPASRNFTSTGGESNPLYNQNAIKPNMDYLLVVEGEKDAISVIAAGEPNVVAVPGCTTAKAEWSHLLDLPKKVYLVFDKDTAGQQGAAKFAERFGPQKCLNVVLPDFQTVDSDGVPTPGKDLSEWFFEGATLEDLKSLMEDAKPFNVDGVSNMDETLDELADELDNPEASTFKYDSPWPTLNRRMGGGNDGHLIIIQAPKKLGKTSIAINWADYLVESKDANVFFECMEMPAKDLARKWVSFITKVDDTPDADGNTQLTSAHVRQAQTIARSRTSELYFGFYPGVQKLEDQFTRLRAVVKRYGIKVLIFDNLQLLVKATHRPSLGPRHEFISRASGLFKMLAMELNILVILIAQSKRLDNDGVADSESLDGSGAPAADCDLMLVVNRAKIADVRSLKQLESMGIQETNENYSPYMHIKADLTRRAPGGWAKLYFEGGLSWIRECKEDEELAATVNSANTINGFTFEPSVEAVLTEI